MVFFRIQLQQRLCSRLPPGEEGSSFFSCCLKTDVGLCLEALRKTLYSAGVDEYSTAESSSSDL